MIKKEKCFADKGDNCSALACKHCDNCNFYRDDIYSSKIESDMRLYTSLKKSDILGKG